MLFILCTSLLSCQADQKEKPSEQADAREIYESDLDQSRRTWGYIDRGGAVAIKPSFEAVHPFFEHHAAVRKENYWGIIDTAGKWIVKPSFRSIQLLPDQRFAAQNVDGNFGLLAMSGDTILPFNFVSIHVEGPYYHCIQEDWHELYDHQATLVFEGAFELFSFVNTHICYTEMGNEKRLYSVDQAKYLPLQIEAARSGGRVQQDGKWGVIDTQGNWKIKPSYTQLSYADVYIGKKADDGYDVIGQDGKKKQHLVADRLYPLGAARLCLQAGDSCFLTDLEGKIRSLAYGNILNFSEGIAAVKGITTDSFGYINLQGNQLYAPQFFLPWECHEGRIRMVDGRGYGYLDTLGHVAIPSQFFEARDFSCGRAAFQY